MAETSQADGKVLGRSVRIYILTELPVEVLAKKFPLRVGHPTKEIYAILDLTAALSNVSLLLNNFFDFPTCLSVIIQAPP